MRFKFLLLYVIVSVYALCEANDEQQVVRFRPITREEYNEILKLTDGKPTITEGRLIRSGLAVFKNLVTLTNGFWPNVLSVFGITQTTTADVEEPEPASYPLCVVQTDTSTTSEGTHFRSEPAELDCIIVLREDEPEEEEVNYEQEYYDDSEAMDMLPDYHQWPYTTFPTAPRPSPYAPYYPPYSYTPYAYYQIYPAFNSFAHHPMATQLHYPSIPPAHSGTSMELNVQGQQQAQSQGDFYNQHSYTHATPSYHMPYYSPYSAHSSAPSKPANTNVNSGPVVHVIRADKRDLSKQRRLRNKQSKKAARGLKKAFRTLDENGYKKPVIPKPQFKDTYPKVSVSRSADYAHPVYIMSRDNFY